MSEIQEDNNAPPITRMRHYADILSPLFWDEGFNEVHRMFEWACTMVRVTGMQDSGWDAYTESQAFLGDITNLLSLQLPADKFSAPSDTHARLALVAYSHMIEMNGAYDLLANALRIRMGLKYSTEPLTHLNKFSKKFNKVMRANPISKIKEIGKMADTAGLPEVGAALKGIYNNTIRNAVYHSDYAVHGGSLRLLSGGYRSKNGTITSLITFDELGEITSETFAFHSALLALWKRQRKLFIDFRDKILPFDEHYKGVVEFTFEEDTLNGFRIYWPNGTVSICARGLDGQSVAQNVTFEPDGSINFFVGLLASRPTSFSPCVETGSEPIYAVVPGTKFRPRWPDDFKPYDVEDI